MTKTALRDIKTALRANRVTPEMIQSLVSTVEELQSRTRRGESLDQPEELPLAAKVNPKKKARGTQAEMEAFAVELGLPKDDGEYFFHKMEATGWKVGGKPILCWKSQIRSWKVGKFLPSQSTQRGNKNGVAVNSGPARCIL